MAYQQRRDRFSPCWRFSMVNLKPVNRMFHSPDGNMKYSSLPIVSSCALQCQEGISTMRCALVSKNIRMAYYYWVPGMRYDKTSRGQQSSFCWHRPTSRGSVCRREDLKEFLPKRFNAYEIFHKHLHAKIYGEEVNFITIYEKPPLTFAAAWVFCKWYSTDNLSSYANISAMISVCTAQSREILLRKDLLLHLQLGAHHYSWQYFLLEFQTSFTWA